jgi:CelD/BcsL family acetyltransferase involved in cellulose biosynthesis
MLDFEPFLAPARQNPKAELPVTGYKSTEPLYLNLANFMAKLQLAGRMREALHALVPTSTGIRQSRGVGFRPIVRDGFRAQCHHDWPDDPAFWSGWNALLKKNPWAMNFRSPVWQTGIVDEFVPYGQFRLVTVHQGEKLVAILPLAFNTASMLETPGKWVSDFLDPLVDSDVAESCWSVILELLMSLWDWSISGIALHHVPAISACRTLLPKISPKRGFCYQEQKVQTTSAIPLPTSWEAYCASLDGHERKEIKRKIRNAETKSGAKWLKLQTAEEVSVALDRVMAMMNRIDSSKGEFADEVLTPFLKRVCPEMAPLKQFYVNELWLEGAPAAWLLVIPSHLGPMIYNTTYDADKQKLSPGAVSFGMAIRDAIAEGFPSFSLLRGGEEYKRRMGAIDADLFRITLTRV